jgi:hypothetical protein
VSLVRYRMREVLLELGRLERVFNTTIQQELEKLTVHKKQLVNATREYQLARTQVDEIFKRPVLVTVPNDN